MKVAIVHYWLVGMRGGEKVLEAFLDMYPDAVIITHVTAVILSPIEPPQLNGSTVMFRKRRTK
uniref:hypothetical protein n=1 Tax=Ruegeria sp. HKCCA5426 TaxID=2682985 RepID=UPI001C2CBD03